MLIVPLAGKGGLGGVLSVFVKVLPLRVVLPVFVKVLPLNVVSGVPERGLVEERLLAPEVGTKEGARGLRLPPLELACGLELLLELASGPSFEQKHDQYEPDLSLIISWDFVEGQPIVVLFQVKQSNGASSYKSEKNCRISIDHPPNIK